jgi:hypothetical protein
MGQIAECLRQRAWADREDSAQIRVYGAWDPVPVRSAARYRQMAPGSGLIDGCGRLRVLVCAYQQALLTAEA